MKAIYILFIFILPIKLINCVAITNSPSLLAGDCVAGFAIAKVLSSKYNIPLLVTPFNHSKIFSLSINEEKLSNQKFDAKIIVSNEQDVIRNLNKNVLLYTDISSSVNKIDSNSLRELQKDLSLIKPPPMKTFPLDAITVAIHVRKGNGGGEHYDGTLCSNQLFDFDRASVKYIHSDKTQNFPFLWHTYIGIKRKIPSLSRYPFPELEKYSGSVWATKFPPEQFYIDQLNNVCTWLPNKKIFVQIFTDDKNPYHVISTFLSATHTNKNIEIYYENNTHLTHEERIAQDLHIMSKTDVLIRSQSYFARIAEMMGDHKLIIYPLKHRWKQNKLIMSTVVINGSITDFKK